MNEIAATPSVGVDASIKAVPDLAKDRATQEAILAATIDAWRPAGAAAGAPLTGAIDPADWDTSATYMTSLGHGPEAGHLDGPRRHDVHVGVVARPDQPLSSAA